MINNTELLARLDALAQRYPADEYGQAAAAIRELAARLEVEQQLRWDAGVQASELLIAEHHAHESLKAEWGLKVIDLHNERKANDMIAQERDAFQEAMERERKAREELYKETIAIASTGQADFKRANAAEAKLVAVEVETIERIKSFFQGVTYGPYEHPIVTINRALQPKKEG